MSTNTTCPPQVQDLDISYIACATGYSENQTNAMEACCGNQTIVRYGKDYCYQYCNVSSREAAKTWQNCFLDQNVEVANSLSVCFNAYSAASPSVRPVSKAGLAILSLVFAGLFGELMV